MSITVINYFVIIFVSGDSPQQRQIDECNNQICSDLSLYQRYSVCCSAQLGERKAGGWGALFALRCMVWGKFVVELNVLINFLATLLL